MKKVFPNKSAMLVYVALYMSHRAFWQRSFGALYRGSRSVFSYSREGFEATPGLRWRFLLPGGTKVVRKSSVLFVFWMRCTGAPVYFAGCLDIP